MTCLSAVVALALAWHSFAAGSASCFDGAGGFSQADWPFCMQLRADMLMYYGPSGDSVKLGMHIADHSGWSSLALGGNGGMKGAHQIVVRMNGSEWIAEDRHSMDYVEPSLDAQQDVTLIFAEEAGGSTSWGVLVPRNSCDADDYSIEDVSRFMQWALGTSHTFSYHAERGAFHANLVSGPHTIPALSGFPEADIRMPNVSLGEGGNDARNRYMCGIFDMAELMPDHDLSKKHHIAKFAAYLNPDSEQYVHHMILYGCSEEAVSEGGATHGMVFPECESMPPGCHEMKWVWAVGVEDNVLPENVGMPIGQGQRWVALQMHYYNPRLDAGIVDSSGVRMVLADSLRDQDAAIFQMNGGTDDWMRQEDLPAGMESVSPSTFVIPGSCTNMWEDDSINVLGVVHHAHLLGKRLQIDVSRGDTFIGTLRDEKHYDFNHQSMEPSLVKKLSRGDQITLTCTYDTSSVTEPVGFGDFTQQEMCWSAFQYYPAQRFNDAFRLPPSSGGTHRTLCTTQEEEEFVPYFTPAAVEYPACQPRGGLQHGPTTTIQTTTHEPYEMPMASGAQPLMATFVVLAALRVA